MPLINWISVAPEDGRTDSDLTSNARYKMNSIGELKVIVDGDELSTDFSQFRVQSESFYVNIPKDNILALHPGPKKLVSDGYWILTESILKPLYLRTFGSCSAGLTKIGVQYDIRLI